MSNYPSILVVAALVIVIFLSLTMLGWCTHRRLRIIQSLPPPTTHIPFDDKLSSCTSLESHSKIFQYKAGETVQGTDQTDCIICLTPFEEEESVRQLHSCKHIFHTLCIDTWLGSHSGCPLCRTQIDHVPSPNGIEEVPFPHGSVTSEENGQNQMILVIVSS